MVKERIVTFGEGKRLVGTLTLPENVISRVLIVNAGIVHRSGPHRLHVKLARALAEKGIAAFRIDLSGLGDSAPAPSGLGHEEQAVEDIREAINLWDEMPEMACLPLSVYGMCSGADNAYEAAKVDPRITGLILIDPYSYSSIRSKIERAAEKVTDLDRWGRALGRAVGLGENPSQETVLIEEDNDRVHPSREEFGDTLAQFAGRGGHLYIRYSNYVQEDLTRPEHFWANFPEDNFKGRLTLEVDPTVDHTHTELAAQEQLIQTLTEWVQRVSSDR